MIKVVINTGEGFDLTHNAIMRYAELKGIKLTAYQYNPVTYLYEICDPPDPDRNTAYFNDFHGSSVSVGSYIDKYFSIYKIDRTDPALIQIVNELKDSEHLDLKIVEVPDDVKWKIEEDEMGPECVRETSRVWK